MKDNWTRRKIIKTAGMAAAGVALLSTPIGKLMAAAESRSELFKRKIYNGLRGLAEYPFFEMTDDGLLRLTVDSLERGIDGHTHFSLNSLAGGEPDLLQSYPKTRYYLPPDIKSSLYVYANQNADQAARKEMTNIMLRTVLPLDSPITDSHTIPNLLREMDLLGIEKSVVFPVQCGWLFGDNMTERYLDAVNRSGKAERFIICGSVKPTQKKAVSQVKAYKEKGLKGIKMHPNMARFFPNDESAWPVYELCGELNLPVLIHSGRTGFKERKTFGMKLYTEDYSDIKNYEAPIAAFPEVRFVLCHSGALQNEQAIEIAKKHSNVWLDIHGQGVDRIQAMIRELGPEQLMYGSDWAFYPGSVILARLLIATENDRTVRQMIFSDNARRFWTIT